MGNRGQARSVVCRVVRCLVLSYGRQKIDLTVFRAVLVLVLMVGWGDVRGGERFRSPSLSEVILFGLRPAKELSLTDYPESGKACVQKYLDALTPGSFLWAFEVPSAPDQAVVARRHILIEQVVTLLGPDVRGEAEAFAYAVPLLVEWEGMSEGPIDEANFANHWLKKRPETPIAPFLHLFRAHRFRAGYEAARARNEKDLWPILAREYWEALKQARLSANPLISCIADDLEKQACIYLEGQGRP